MGSEKKIEPAVYLLKKGMKYMKRIIDLDRKVGPATSFQESLLFIIGFLIPFVVAVIIMY